VTSDKLSNPQKAILNRFRARGVDHLVMTASKNWYYVNAQGESLDAYSCSGITEPIIAAMVRKGLLMLCPETKDGSTARRYRLVQKEN
jgi:hypothetical protein